MTARPFIKSRDTDATVPNSKAELERILQRYGAFSYGVHQHWEDGYAAVTFSLPDPATGVPLRVQLDVRPRLVASKLFPGQAWETLRERDQAQAQRVAWRHLVLLVDAACLAAASGVRPMAHTFLAETLVQSRDGRTVQLVEAIQEEAPRLLGPG